MFFEDTMKNLGLMLANKYFNNQSMEFQIHVNPKLSVVQIKYGKGNNS